MPSPNLAPLVPFVLVAVMLFRRIRRQFGRQPLNPRPITIRLVVLGIAAVALIGLAIAQPLVALPMAAGLFIGALIAGINLRLTRFEWSAGGDAYYPHPYVGAALSLLLVGRIAYRYYVLGGMPGMGSQPPAPPFQSPLTFGLLALLIGYYVAYSIGLLVIRHRYHRTAVT
jgi:hypothetical protein